MKIYLIWLIGVILWNFGFPNAIPIADVIAAILLSFLSRASEISGKKIYVKLDQNEILLNLNVNICSSFFNQEFPKFVDKVEIKFLNNQDNFTEIEWNNLYKLAENTFVEESDSLKQGAAGAGLTDND